MDLEDPSFAKFIFNTQLMLRFPGRDFLELSLAPSAEEETIKQLASEL